MYRYWSIAKWTLDSLPPKAQNNSYLTSTNRENPGKYLFPKAIWQAAPGLSQATNGVTVGTVLLSELNMFQRSSAKQALSRLCWPELQIISNYCINAYIGPQKESNRSIWTCLQMGHTVPPNGRFNQKNHGKSSLSTKFRLSHVFQSNPYAAVPKILGDSVQIPWWLP